MTWQPAQRPGDTDPLISDAKSKLGKFSYGKGLGSSDVYTVEFGVSLTQFQSNRKIEIEFGQKPGPQLSPTGVFDWATKKQLGLIPDPPSEAKKLIVTVAGHLGNQFDGPAYICAKWMEDRKLVRVMPVGYNNVDIPFQNQTGFDAVMEQIHDPVMLPRGTEWAMMAHSQGAIIAADIMDVIATKRDQWPYSHFKGGVQFGNPRRPRGVVAQWIADPPPAGNQGLAHNCLTAKFPGVEEASRKGDLYADNRPDSAGEYKTAIYRAVMGDVIGGPDTLAEQIGELVKSGGLQLWDVFRAIVDGIQGAAGLDKHNVFDLGPCIDHMRAILKV
jgi:hypothetical protein